MTMRKVSVLKPYPRACPHEQSAHRLSIRLRKGIRSRVNPGLTICKDK